MRKLLLAGATAFLASGGMLGVASAQTPPGSPMQGTLPTKPSAGAYAIDNNSAEAKLLPGPIANPTPGTMVLRLGVRVQADMAASWTSLDKAGGNELFPYRFMEYMRIYPGMDAMAANGLRYGGAVELRQNFPAPPGSTGSSGGTTYSTGQTVFVRRELIYVAGDQWGLIRFGEADGLIGLYDGGGQTTGVFLAPTGTIVGGDAEGVAPGNAYMTPYFGAQSGNEYVPTKLVYMSPSFAGFDFGLQYQPDTYNGFTNCSSAAAGAACPNLASTTIAGVGSRAKDQFEVGARYRGVLGGAKVLAYAIYVGSGHTNYTGGIPARAAGSTYTGNFDNLSIGMFGANIKFGGLAVFGNVMIGDYNGILALKPVGAPSAKGWGAGVKYTTGPFTIGGVYSAFDSQGDVALTGVSQRHEQVFDVAGTYTIAPGMTAFAEYVYGTRYQGGFNFGTGSDSVRAQSVLVGTVLKW